MQQNGLREIIPFNVVLNCFWITNVIHSLYSLQQFQEVHPKFQTALSMNSWTHITGPDLIFFDKDNILCVIGKLHMCLNIIEKHNILHI